MGIVTRAFSISGNCQKSEQNSRSLGHIAGLARLKQRRISLQKQLLVLQCLKGLVLRCLTRWGFTGKLLGNWNVCVGICPTRKGGHSWNFNCCLRMSSELLCLQDNWSLVFCLMSAVVPFETKKETPCWSNKGRESAWISTGVHQEERQTCWSKHSHSESISFHGHRLKTMTEIDWEAFLFLCQLFPLLAVSSPSALLQPSSCGCRCVGSFAGKSLLDFPWGQGSAEWSLPATSDWWHLEMVTSVLVDPKKCLRFFQGTHQFQWWCSMLPGNCLMSATMEIPTDSGSWYQDSGSIQANHTLLAMCYAIQPSNFVAIIEIQPNQRNIVKYRSLCHEKAEILKPVEAYEIIVLTLPKFATAFTMWLHQALLDHLLVDSAAAPGAGSENTMGFLEISGFPKLGVPHKGWFLRTGKCHLKFGWFGGTPISGNQ